MTWKKSNLPTALRIINAFILLVGLSSAFLIFRTSENVPTGILGYEQGDGEIYPILPDDSKKYLRALELYGGKANVLMDQARRWFAGLWQGKSLAFTVAGITLLIFMGIFYLANHLPSNSEPDNRSESDPDKSQ